MKETIDYTEIRDVRIRGVICKLMTEMLGNLDKHGLYPTSKFMWEMETFILKEKANQPNKLGGEEGEHIMGNGSGENIKGVMKIHECCGQEMSSWKHLNSSMWHCSKCGKSVSEIEEGDNGSGK